MLNPTSFSHAPPGVKMLVCAAMVLMDTVVFALFWSWFVTPFGLPSLRFAHALGLMMLVGLLGSDVPRERPETPREVLVEHATTRIILLVLGCICAFFVGSTP